MHAESAVTPRAAAERASAMTSAAQEHSRDMDAANSSSHSVATLSIRFQCPLCFDVLRRPILLPCCRRHLW